MTGSPPEAAGAASPASARRPWLRLLLLVLLIAGLAAAGEAAGLRERLTVESIRAGVRQAGAWGVLGFLVAFCLGELLHVPGMVFVLASVLAFGRVPGAALAFVGAVLSVSVTFWVVRTVGGRPLAGVERPWMRRALGRLEAHPVTTVAVLRTVFWISPPLNYALALSSLRFREYLLGSALGLLTPVLLAAVAADALLAHRGLLSWL